MTIVSEINAIVTENGGTASTDGTIIGALDALADTLAGENVERQDSITRAIEALAPYISTGAPVHSIAFDEDYEGQVEFAVLEYSTEIFDPIGEPLTETAAGTLLIVYARIAEESAADHILTNLCVLVGGETVETGLPISSQPDDYGAGGMCVYFVMPDRDDVFITASTTAVDINDTQ